MRVLKTLSGHIFPHVFMSIFGNILALHMYLNYGNTGYGVSTLRIQNELDRVLSRKEESNEFIDISSKWMVPSR